MKPNIEELREWRDDAKHGLREEAERLEEKGRMLNGYLRVLDAVDSLLSDNDDLTDKVERQQQEIDDLHEQLEAKEGEIASLQQQHQVEIETLQRQLLEAQNVHLQTEKQHLEAEVKAKPLEIHNHFESGSSSQVFNDKVHGKFEKLMKSGKSEKSKKKEKKRWKRIVRKML